MKEKIKTIYLILGIIFLVLVIVFMVLNIFGLKLNLNYFTYNEKKCIEKMKELDERYRKLFEDTSTEDRTEFSCKRPPLFIRKR